MDEPIITQPIRMVNITEIPSKERTFRRDPGRIALYRQVLSSLVPDSALVVDCPTPEAMQTIRCGLLVAGRKQIATRKRGQSLYVFLKAGSHG